MNFYKFIFATALIFTFLHNSVTDKNLELVYVDSGISAPSPKSIGLVFFIKINNTSDRNDYDVEVTPDQCCLKEGVELDCDSLKILGGCTDFVPKGKTKKVTVLAPLLNQYGREGHCTIYVYSKSNNDQNKRDTIKINFDTKLSKNNFDHVNNLKRCEHEDEDVLNDCKPVNCDTYYNGKKTYFRKTKRCVDIPTCIKDDGHDYPNIIYNPFKNQCCKESIIKEDLDYIKKLNKDTDKIRKVKDVLIINKFRSNASDLTVKDVLIDDIGATTISHLKNTKYIKVAALNMKPTLKPYCKNAECFKLFFKKYFIDNKWTLMVLILVVTVQCFLICTMIYCLSKTCNCCEDKKVIHKFFNYRQDVSVTTPLIGTSNIDTETADYQYLTESSNNVDQKIKCYKSCQKDNSNNNNIKKSMSDDILSKCLNRRDWKKFKPEAITEPENILDLESNISNKDQVNDNAKNEEKRILNETKVMFEDETVNINDNKISKSATEECLNENRDIKTNLSSEKEIKCHSYNRFDAGFAEFRANLAKNTGIFKGGKCKKRSTSNSTEKGAQAYFSNDSIDDFLSERGVIYLAGENMSKYTISSNSSNMKPSITSSASSRTSKNFVKNVLSMLHKRSKHSPSSDPGQTKDTDVELIHISRASIYSSTNDSDCIKTLKRKDSRTSF